MYTWGHTFLLAFWLLADYWKLHFLFHLFFFLCPPSVPFIVDSNHGGGPPGGGLSVHRHTGGHRSAAVPPGPHWDLPLWCALLEEAYHQTQGISTPCFTPVICFVCSWVACVCVLAITAFSPLCMSALASVSELHVDESSKYSVLLVCPYNEFSVFQTFLLIQLNLQVRTLQN